MAGATPTFTEISTILQNTVDIMEELRKYGEVNAKNLINQIDTLTQSIEGEFSPGVLASMGGIRGLISSALGSGSAALTPILQEFMRNINEPDVFNDPQAMIGKLYQHFIDNTLSVVSRGFTFGTPTADGSNLGDGVINRLTKDVEGFDIESQFPEPKSALCTTDQNTGAQKNQEVFTFQGGDPGADLLEFQRGSGLVQDIAASSKTDSDALIGNSSFDTATIGVSSGTINDWTSSAAETTTNFSLNTGAANVFHKAINEFETPQSLGLKVTLDLTQKLSRAGTVLEATVPYYMSIHFNASINSSLGTLKIELGTNTVSVVVDGLSGWQTLRLPLDKNLWYKNFDQQDLQVKVDWVRTGGTDLLIDDIIFVPMENFDNSFYVIEGGETPFLATTGVLDKFTWADTATDSKVQRWFWRAFRRYLPHALASVATLSDP